MTTDNIFNERVVKVVETCDGRELRTFYGIHDPEFGHWMSQEPFDGMIWTKDLQCRQEFDTRDEAEATLADFLQWRRERDVGDDPVDQIPFDREAA